LLLEEDGGGGLSFSTTEALGFFFFDFGRTGATGDFAAPATIVLGDVVDFPTPPPPLVLLLLLLFFFLLPLE
jgi:hypothetical protein